MLSTKRWHSRAVGAAIAVARLLSARTGQCDEAAAAQSEEHILRGFDLRKLGRDVDALAEFQKAYELDPTPRARAQMALALQAIGDWVGAERGLDEALRASEDPWIARYRDALQGARSTAQSHLAWLTVDVNVYEGGVLLVNGVPVESLPLMLPVRVAAGALEIEVRADGWAPAHRAVYIAPGANLEERLELHPLDRAFGPVPSPLTRGPAMAVAPATASADRANRVSGAQVAGWVLLSSAALLAGGGVVAWRVREDQVAEFNDDSVCLQGSRTRDEQCGAFATRANLALGVEIGTFAAAAVAGALGAWWVWHRPARSPQTSIPCTLLGPRAAIACRWDF